MKYRNREMCDAVQIEDNWFDSVIAVEDEVKKEDKFVTIVGTEQRGGIGDWVVNFASGKQTLMTNEEFEKLYELLPTDLVTKLDDLVELAFQRGKENPDVPAEFCYGMIELFERRRVLVEEMEKL